MALERLCWMGVLFSPARPRRDLVVMTMTVLDQASEGKLPFFRQLSLSILEGSGMLDRPLGEGEGGAAEHARHVRRRGSRRLFEAGPVS